MQWSCGSTAHNSTAEDQFYIVELKNRFFLTVCGRIDTFLSGKQMRENFPAQENISKLRCLSKH